jgi:ATP-dependent Clp protease adaptor protein ClpS
MVQEDIKVKTHSKVEVASYEPSMWKVIFHNDEVTPMQFVTQCLIEIFHKTEEQAVTLVKSIHDQGKGIAGIYPYDIAETKSLETTEVARSNNYPLKVSIEKE